MKVYTITLGELSTNCHILEYRDGACVLIDIGNGAKKLRNKLTELDLKPQAILLTHGHYDHIAGVEEIRKTYDCPVYIHSNDAMMLVDENANLAWQLTTAPYIPVTKYQTVQDGDIIKVDNLEFRVMLTKGHTSGSVCYICGDYLFSGDTLFRGSVGRTDLGGNAQEMMESIQKLKAITKDYQVYCGHFESTTLSREQKYNPYFRGL
ncbi:MAG: MBL fold metallo-hydrolase [Oscillospiraceae bacterium]